MWVLSITMTGFPALTKSQLNREHKATWLSLGKEWRKRFLGGHFTKAGARKYGFALRKGMQSWSDTKPQRGSYSWAKLKRRGHLRPLEYYGDSKRRALGEEKLAATRDGVKIRLPQGFNRRHPRSAVRMHDEIRAVLPREVITLARHWSRTFEGRMNRIGARRTVRAAA